MFIRKYSNALRPIAARDVYISQNCLPNGLPDVDAAVSIASGSGNYALVGLSQAQMLRSDSALAAKLDEVLSYPISGYGIVLLDHCEQTLQKFMNRDIRVKNRVLLVTERFRRCHR